MKLARPSPSEAAADHAFEVHAALLCAERMQPSLRANPLWRLHRQDAAEDFARAWEKLS